jgi:hypothetical protein
MPAADHTRPKRPRFRRLALDSPEPWGPDWPGSGLAGLRCPSEPFMRGWMQPPRRRVLEAPRALLDGGPV